MTTVLRLDLLESKLAVAREALAKIEALRASHDARTEALVTRRTDLVRLIGYASIASALGEVPADYGDNLREELATVTREIELSTAAHDAASDRIGPAREAVNHAGVEWRAEVDAFSKTLLREEMKQILRSRA